MSDTPSAPQAYAANPLPHDLTITSIETKDVRFPVRRTLRIPPLQQTPPTNLSPRPRSTAQAPTP